MNLDDFQKSWQAQGAAPEISINADALLHEVRRKQQCFRRTIFWRDVREVSAAIILVPIFISGAWRVHWSLYLCAIGCIVLGADIVLDRLRQRKKTPDLHSSLKECATTSLAEVCHQIWLLKNVVWWYLLPLLVPMLVFFGWCAWSIRGPLLDRILNLSYAVGLVLVIDVGIYWLNQFAVRKSLEPRRRELEALLTNLESENQIAPMKRKPLRPFLLMLVICVLAIAAHAAWKSSLGTGIDAIGKEHNVPALAVIVTKDGQIRDRAVTGVRKWGDPTLVTTNDVFHIGSCTKSMTATLAAMFIEQGKLRWDTTIAEAFPELKGKMDKRYEAVTVDQLLHHRGGVPSEPPAAAWKRAWEEIGTPVDQRREYIEAVLTAPPEAAPGTKKIYSNDGYNIVGTMLERISGQDFESLMAEKLFKPLHMDTAGFGLPAKIDKVDQPWGHTRKLLKTQPAQTDNPPVLSPAGRVHCSLDDLARYAMFHLQSGTNALLKPETMERLHASPKGAVIKEVMDDYACGWVRMKRGWAGGRVLWHNGSNTMWYIVMWLAPEKNFCVIAATNIAGPDAEKACDDACVMMIEKWLPK